MADPPSILWGFYDNVDESYLGLSDQTNDLDCEEWRKSKAHRKSGNHLRGWTDGTFICRNLKVTLNVISFYFLCITQ